MTKNTPLPGEARAEGPSIADTLRSDAVPAPAPLLETAYTFLGDQDISTSRYTSRDFFEQEMEKVWAKSWQWACREEHLPDVGDNYVYDIVKLFGSLGPSQGMILSICSCSRRHQALSLLASNLCIVIHVMCVGAG